MDGDVAVQRQLQAGGTKLRFEVGKAIAKLTQEALQVARSAAPTARTRAGINAYGYGFESNDAPRGRGVPKVMTLSVQAVQQANRAGSVATMISNEYYLGRFRETGFSDQVEVRAHTRRAKGRKTWTRPKHVQTIYKSFLKSGITRLGEMSHKAKGYGWNDRQLRLLVKGGQISVDFYKRRHKVRQHRFFSYAEETVMPKFEAAIQEAIRKGMAG